MYGPRKITESLLHSSPCGEKGWFGSTSDSWRSKKGVFLVGICMSESLFPTKDSLEGLILAVGVSSGFFTFHDINFFSKFSLFFDVFHVGSPSVTQVVLHFPENQLSTTWGSLIFAAAAARLSSETDATCHQSLEIKKKYLDSGLGAVFVAFSDGMPHNPRHPSCIWIFLWRPYGFFWCREFFLTVGSSAQIRMLHVLILSLLRKINTSSRQKLLDLVLKWSTTPTVLASWLPQCSNFGITTWLGWDYSFGCHLKLLMPVKVNNFRLFLPIKLEKRRKKFQNEDALLDQWFFGGRCVLLLATSPMSWGH